MADVMTAINQWAQHHKENTRMHAWRHLYAAIYESQPERGLRPDVMVQRCIEGLARHPAMTDALQEWAQRACTMTWFDAWSTQLAVEPST